MSNPTPHPLRPYYVPTPSLPTPSIPSPPPLPQSSARHAEFHYHADYSYSLPPVFGSAIVAFLGTGLVMPLEVGKTLLQLRAAPTPSTSHVGSISAGSNTGFGGSHHQEEEEEEEDEYFSNPSLPPTPRTTKSTQSTQQLSRHHQHQHPSSAQPKGKGKVEVKEWELRVDERSGEKDGVWEMVKRVRAMRGEGGWSLWKGQMTTFILDTMSTNLQPLVQTILQPLVSSAHPFSRSILLLTVSSHLLTTVLLSPFDLIRTRLIVQSAMPQHRKYSGPLDALDTVVREEGGWWRAFWGEELMSSTIVEGILRPLVHFGGPMLIFHWLGSEREDSPMVWAVGELVISTVGLGLTLPIETIRKRLQAQTRYTANPTKPFRTVVPVREPKGEGMLEMWWNAMKEDGGRSLYHGFSIGVVTNLVVFG
ncbi:mitochondrial carrier, partial [Atractiella rhizophila]